MKPHALRMLGLVLPFALVIPLSAQGGGRGGDPGRARAGGPPTDQSMAGGRGAVGARPTTDPFGKYLFPPELIMMKQTDIGLTDGQRELIQSEVQKAQQSITATQFRIGAESEKLEKLLQMQNVDEARVLAQVDGILSFERQVKRAHIAMLVRIHNALTQEQQTKLSEVSGSFQFDTGSQTGSGSFGAGSGSGGGRGVGRGGRGGGGFGGGGTGGSGGFGGGFGGGGGSGGSGVPAPTAGGGGH